MPQTVTAQLIGGPCDGSYVPQTMPTIWLFKDRWYLYAIKKAYRYKLIGPSATSPYQFDGFETEGRDFPLLPMPKQYPPNPAHL